MNNTQIILSLCSWRSVYDGDRHLGEKGSDEPGPGLSDVSFDSSSEVNVQTDLSTANNFLICEIAHSGTASGDQTKSTPIFGKPGTQYSPKQALFTFSQLLKSEFHGEALLKLSVIDIDPKSKAGRFFRRVLAASMGTVLAGPIGGISGVLAAATANELSGMLTEGIKGNQEDEVKATIMEAMPMVLSKTDSGDLKLQRWDNKANRLTDLAISSDKKITVPFLATAEVVDLVRTRIAGRRGTHAIEKRRITRYAKGSVLGEAVLQIS